MNLKNQFCFLYLYIKKSDTIEIIEFDPNPLYICCADIHSDIKNITSKKLLPILFVGNRIDRDVFIAMVMYILLLHLLYCLNDSYFIMIYNKLNFCIYYFISQYDLKKLLLFLYK
jgi:hypothetical protein